MKAPTCPKCYKRMNHTVTMGSKIVYTCPKCGKQEINLKLGVFE